MAVSVRTVRWLCWALVIFAIISALLTIFFSFGIVVPPPPPIVDDLVQQVELNRIGDQAIWPYVFVQQLANVGIFAVTALLGTVLRPWAGTAGVRDVMTLMFVMGGVLGITASLLNIGLSQAATFGYCDCGYKTEELIAQDWALRIGYQIVNWLNIAGITAAATGVAMAGRLIHVSAPWRTLSYVIVAVVLLGVALRVVAAFVFIEAFDPFRVSDLIVALAAGILVPIWAIVLARGLGRAGDADAPVAPAPAPAA